jgi:hypothetical protein
MFLFNFSALTITETVRTLWPNNTVCNLSLLNLQEKEIKNKFTFFQIIVGNAYGYVELNFPGILSASHGNEYISEVKPPIFIQDANLISDLYDFKYIVKSIRQRY